MEVVIMGFVREYRGKYGHDENTRTREQHRLLPVVAIVRIYILFVCFSGNCIVCVTWQ